MRCLIVDDDPIALAVIEAHARRAGLEVEATAASAEEGTQALALAPDVAFCDIELPDGSGLDLARRAAEMAEVVLVTSRERYAVDAFALGAADYLLKPVAYERFEQAVERVRRLRAARIAPAEAAAQDLDGALPDGPVFVRSGADLVRVDLQAVDRVEAERDYVRLHGPNVRLHGTMKALAPRLPAPFVRVHRSHIVRLDRVEGLDDDGVTVAGEWVPTGGTYRAGLVERLRVL